VEVVSGVVDSAEKEEFFFGIAGQMSRAKKWQGLFVRTIPAVSEISVYGIIALNVPEGAL
jgi:hypothetical protein